LQKRHDTSQLNIIERYFERERHKSDRQILKDRSPESVFREFDLAGRLTYAHVWQATSPGIQFQYDSAGRLMTETSYGRAVGSQYDKAGNRIRVTWPDNVYVDYTYDAANRLKEVRENGATSGAGLLPTTATAR
jgi:YD repeat-containing protein